MSAPTLDAALTSVDATTYRSAFRAHAAAVVVVTADAGRGPAGFTATSLASVSLDPPLISFALDASSSSWPTIERADAVVVNFLDVADEGLAARFATSGIDRFAPPTTWSRLATGEPQLDDAPAHLRAEIVARLPAGDHRIVLAHVVEACAHRTYSPLIYHRGSYRALPDHPDHPDHQETTP